MIALVVANAVLAASVRAAAMIDVVCIGVEIHAGDAVLIPERAAAMGSGPSRCRDHARISSPSRASTSSFVSDVNRLM